MGPAFETFAEKAIEVVKDVASRFELPDDSGERKYSSELPDDSGEKMQSKKVDRPKNETEHPLMSGLSEKEKNIIMNESGWSNDIVNCIANMEQYEKVYRDAGLHEAIVDGRKCLIKNIDMKYIDTKTGLTNQELMLKGRAPIDSKTGEKIELHHMGQDFNGPLAELCENSEHGDGNDTLLHNKGTESWRQDPENMNLNTTIL